MPTLLAMIVALTGVFVFHKILLPFIIQIFLDTVGLVDLVHHDQTASNQFET